MHFTILVALFLFLFLSSLAAPAARRDNLELVHTAWGHGSSENGCRVIMAAIALTDQTAILSPLSGPPMSVSVDVWLNDLCTQEGERYLGGVMLDESEVIFDRRLEGASVAALIPVHDILTGEESELMLEASWVAITEPVKTPTYTEREAEVTFSMQTTTGISLSTVGSGMLRSDWREVVNDDPPKGKKKIQGLPQISQR